MPNANAPFGFKPVNRDGSPYSGGTLRCVMLATTGTAIFVGDPVQLDGSADATTGIASVKIGAASSPVYGVVTAIEANPDNLTQQYRLASTKRFCQVAPATDTYFLVQSDDDTTALLVSDVGMNAGFIFTETDSTAYGISAAELDSSSATTTTSLDLQIVGFSQEPGNDLSAGVTAGSGGTNKNVVVRFNVPQGRPERLGV